MVVDIISLNAFDRFGHAGTSGRFEAITDDLEYHRGGGSAEQLNVDVEYSGWKSGKVDFDSLFRALEVVVENAI